MRFINYDGNCYKVTCSCILKRILAFLFKTPVLFSLLEYQDVPFQPEFDCKTVSFCSAHGELEMWIHTWSGAKRLSSRASYRSMRCGENQSRFLYSDSPSRSFWLNSKLSRLFGGLKQKYRLLCSLNCIWYSN